jgi:hypothetical protein
MLKNSADSHIFVNFPEFGLCGSSSVAFQTDKSLVIGLPGSASKLFQIGHGICQLFAIRIFESIPLGEFDN